MRHVIRTVVVLAVVVTAAYFLGFWSLNPGTMARLEEPVGTGGDGAVSSVHRDAPLGDRVAQAAKKVDDILSEAGQTAKIKSKMALDDTVSSHTIDVSTDDGVVTLTGTVGSVAERARVVRLARDTNGIRRVIDRLDLRR